MFWMIDCIIPVYVLIFCYSLFCLQALICLVDKKTGDKSKTRPRFVKQDQVCIARLRTAGTICLETFKDFPQMGRFTLRDEGRASTDAVVLFDHSSFSDYQFIVTVSSRAKTTNQRSRHTVAVFIRKYHLNVILYQSL